MIPTPWRNPPDGLIAVGEVLTTHGLKGEVKISPLTDDKERWLELKRVFLCSAKDRRELEVEGVRFHRETVIVKFHGICTVEEVEKFRGLFLWIPRHERPPLPEGRFYIDDLLDLEVHDDEDHFLGLLKKILPTGANDVFLIQGGCYGEILLPALRSVVLSVDLCAGKMVVRLPAGLVEGPSAEKRSNSAIDED